MTITLSPISAQAVILKTDDSDGFLRKLACLVAQIYSTFSQISQNERSEIVQFELKYKTHSFESSDMTRTRGKFALGFACISMGIFVASLAFANMNDRKFVQLASEKAPDLARLFDASHEANIKNRDSLAQLEMSKLQDKNNKSQSDGNIKDQFAQVLQAEIQRLRSASSSN
jgi:hypothetical protein